MTSLIVDADRDAVRERMLPVVQDIVRPLERRRARSGRSIGGAALLFGAGAATGAAAIVACAALGMLPTGGTETPRKSAPVVARRAPIAVASVPERPVRAAERVATDPEAELALPAVKTFYAAEPRLRPMKEPTRPPRTETPSRPQLAKALPALRRPERVANPDIAVPLTGEALRLALIEDRKRTRRLNEAELNKIDDGR